jgi:hypothetical protein
MRLDYFTGGITVQLRRIDTSISCPVCTGQLTMLRQILESTPVSTKRTH